MSTKVVAYKILPELKLIIEVLAGSLGIPDAIELKEREVNDSLYNPGYNFIVVANFVEATLDTDVDFSAYIDTLTSSKKMVAPRKSAILTQTPQQVVFGTLYKHAIQTLPIDFKIVSTLKAALKWINLPMELEETIQNHIDAMLAQ